MSKVQLSTVLLIVSMLQFCMKVTVITVYIYIYIYIYTDTTVDITINGGCIYSSVAV